MGLQDTANAPIDTPAYVRNMAILPTSQLTGPATGEAYFGDYSEVLVGTRLAIDYQTLRERSLDEDKIGVIPRCRYDIAVRHGASFAVRTALST